MNQKRVLFLTVEKKPFNEIRKGTKLIEYRDKKDYWKDRLLHSNGSIKFYDEVYLRNGYSKRSPFCRVKWLGLMTHTKKFQILLGKVLEVGNLDGNK